MIFLKNRPRREVFCNVNFSNLENILQRTDMAGECNFRACGGTNFGNFSTQRQP